MTIEQLRQKITRLLDEFSEIRELENIRERVLSLIPVVDTFSHFGKSLIPNGLEISAQERILRYFQTYPRTIIGYKEIMIISGISEWARRVRELRVQMGWPIISGITAKEMFEQEPESFEDLDVSGMRPKDYILLDAQMDREAAYRWNVANGIRKEKIGMREKILKYLQLNVGKRVTGEELRYIARGSEWARRIRELRTEDGWPIVTKTSGDPDLPIGVYVLARDRQTPNHDRRISDSVRGKVLRRDNYTCQNCGWSRKLWTPDDPRFLELHHVQHHAKGGESTVENLITYCNICHDQIHKIEKNS